MHIIGEGAFSEVFRVKRKSDQQDYALKKVDISANQPLIGATYEIK